VSKGNPSEVFLQLIEENSFNSMDGKKIAFDLRRDRFLWEAVMFHRPGDGGTTLRDMADGSYNADTVTILTDMVREKTLYETLKQWEPDSITMLTPTAAWRSERDDDGYRLLKVVRELDREDKLSSFLGSNQKNETRVVFRLWWD